MYTNIMESLSENTVYNFQLVSIDNVVSTINSDPTNPYNNKIQTTLSNTPLISSNNTKNTKLLLGINQNPSDTIVSEIIEFKNLFLCIFYDNFHLTNEIVKFMSTFLQEQTSCPYLFKYIDYKLIFYIPHDLNISSAYKSGPIDRTFTGHILPQMSTWFCYVVKINQYVAHAHYPERHAKQRKNKSSKSNSIKQNVTMES